MSRLLTGLIDRWRAGGLRRRLAVECNFTPSCSAYAREAVARHGAWTGGRLALARLRRCNQRDQVGRIDDPVPSR